MFNRQHLLGDMQAGPTEIHSICLRLIAVKAKDNYRKLMKYRGEKQADADRPTKGFLRAAEVRAKRIQIPALKRPHSTAKGSSLRDMARIAGNLSGTVSRAQEMGNLPLPDNQVDRALFLGKIQRRISEKETIFSETNPNGSSPSCSPFTRGFSHPRSAACSDRPCYRIRAELRPTTPGEADCPFGGSDWIHPATDPGETMEHV